MCAIHDRPSNHVVDEDRRSEEIYHGIRRTEVEAIGWGPLRSLKEGYIVLPPKRTEIEIMTSSSDKYYPIHSDHIGILGRLLQMLHHPRLHLF